MKLYLPPICERAVKYAGSSVTVRRERDGAEMPAHLACARWRPGYALVDEPARGDP